MGDLLGFGLGGLPVFGEGVEDGLDDLLESEVGGVDGNDAIGLAEGGAGAGRVDLVAGEEGGLDGLDGLVGDAFLDFLGLAALGADGGVGLKVEARGGRW